MKSRKHLADLTYLAYLFTLYTFLFSITILGKSASHFLEINYAYLLDRDADSSQNRGRQHHTGGGGRVSAGRINICLSYVKIHTFNYYLRQLSLSFS